MNQILDTALVAHVAIVDDDQPYALPVGFARDGDRLLLHGSAASRLFKKLADGKPCCATITIMDGLVMARSAFESSMHYRCVMVLGEAVELHGDEKVAAFDLLVKAFMPGRELEVRKSTEKELKATTLVALSLDEASVKVSNFEPGDLPEDMDSPLWAGVIPIEHTFGTPRDAADLKPGIPVPGYIAEWTNGRT
ncbi:MAG: pyridoxamine 5'-phosphate oxidase family protein [Actinobacteria bacterium]|jgi:nitroimidazol reductase NimA-like FMN-containing flavoprotein (pyridoxamine 5'-phosphate oxidase superfamily)|nr:pyridoxamine 5'-phosphate oxidase family protein [Actinomycetota bacterium]NBP91422.1 pyridoxamine 5'-phosphate oxidase family protein [Actinomycetota bacterium]